MLKRASSSGESIGELSAMVMDGLATYADLAEAASRYSFRLTGLRRGGEAKEVEREWRSADRERERDGEKERRLSDKKVTASMAHPFFLALASESICPHELSKKINVMEI